MSKDENLSPLRLNELGLICLGDHVVRPGSILEVIVHGHTHQVCLEMIHGTSYLIPQIDLDAEHTARLVE